MKLPYLNVPDVAERRRLFLGMYALGCDRGGANDPEAMWVHTLRRHPDCTVFACADLTAMHIYAPGDTMGQIIDGIEPVNSVDHFLRQLKRAKAANRAPW